MVIKDISFSSDKEGSIVVGIYSDGSLSESASKLDETLNGFIAKAIAKTHFSGKLFETVSFVSIEDKIDHIIAVGLGEKDKIFSNFELQKLGASIYSVAAHADEIVTVSIDLCDIKTCEDSSIAYIAFGSLLKSWDFDKYKSTKNEKIKIKKMILLSSNTEGNQQNFDKLKKIADGIFLTREVVSEPANVIYPESLSEIAQKELLGLGVDVEILNKTEMQKLGMDALLGVAKGSDRDPKLVVLKWNGCGNDSEPLAFVGKGVTFDSGGISIKPSDNMHEMRFDMAGSGVVLGLMKAIALCKLKVNAVGVMALVENMPSGSAQRPGDIVKSMSGQTIEVLNTDAEGRLILADAMWYTQDRFKPKMMIDLATLTGAIVVALGHEFAGLFSNCDDLADKIVKSSIETGEKVWRMPMSEHFDNGINSEVADMQNIGKANIRGSSITAAQFLKRFTNNVAWAHIDIAGVETSNDDLFICSKGATGFGVHLLFDLIQKNYVD